MAAALAFRTIFGMIPVVVIATLLFRAFGGADVFADFVEHVLAAAKLNDVSGPDEATSLAEWARTTILQVDADIHGRTIGVIGGLVLAWAAIKLLTTIERCFNAICHAPEHRSLARRIPLYWTAITIGPILLYLSFRIESRFINAVQEWGGAGHWASAIGFVTACLATWCFLLGAYVLMPYTKVPRSAAAIGAAVGAFLWTGATSAFGTYIEWSFSKGNSTFTIVYSSLGLIPLFLFWIYFLWLIVLYGLEVTRLVQIVGSRMDDPATTREEWPPVVDPASAIPVAEVIAERFERGLSTSADEVVEATRFGRRSVNAILESLVETGVLHRLEQQDEPTYTLARPSSQVTTGELLAIGQQLTSRHGPGDAKVWQWVRQFREAQLDLPLHRPLAELAQVDPAKRDDTDERR
jgi:membrane protein